MKLISDKDLKTLSQRLASKINDLILEELPTLMLEFDDDNVADFDDIEIEVISLEDDIKEIVDEELKSLPDTEEE